MVKITFPDGSVREYESGVTGLQIAESISPALARNVVSCGINGETVELNRPITADSTIALYKFEDEEGKHTFWHTSAHLLAEALQELYPGIQFGFGPAVENGFFYDVMPAEGQVISENDFPKIEEKMRELAKKNEAVVRREVSKAKRSRSLRPMVRTTSASTLSRTSRMVPSPLIPRATLPTFAVVRTFSLQVKSRQSRLPVWLVLSGVVTPSASR